MRCLKPDQAQSKCRVALYLADQSTWIKTTTSRLSYELGINGEKKSMETRILVIKMDITLFTLELYHTITLEFIEDENHCQKIILVINILR